MPDLLFSTADLADMQAFGAANRPHTADVQHRVSVRQPGGTFTDTWPTEQTALPCRLATVGTPAERLTAGSFAEIKEFRVAFDVDVQINSADRRLVVTHDVPGIPSPITLYVTGSTAHSFEMERVVLATTEGGE